MNETSNQYTTQYSVKLEVLKSLNSLRWQLISEIIDIGKALDYSSSKVQEDIEMFLL